jgi:hypothetical protein
MKRVVVIWRAAFADFRVTIEDASAEDDEVACRVTAGGTHR